jgi:hypothetical protein
MIETAIDRSRSLVDQKMIDPLKGTAQRALARLPRAYPQADAQ